MQPGLTWRIGEVGDIARPALLISISTAAETRGDRGGERLNFRFVQYVTAPGEHLTFWIFVLQRRMGASQPIRVAAAKATFAPSPSSRRSVSKPIPDETAGDYRDASFNLCIHRAPLPYA